ncbi:MAG: DUF2318 domain-containing protein [Dethiobacter sp.]|nr:DUF2318 domain-containing protein [Dethiobacter sp.]
MTPDDKKREFAAKRKSHGPNRLVILIFILAGIGGTLVFAWANRGATGVPRRWEGGSYNIGRPMSYSGIIQMTDIDIETVNGKVRIPLQALLDEKIIYTEYIGGTRIIPLVAFISPSGRVIAAISMCEPCRSQRFHINGTELVCDTCRTTWRLTDLKGIAGGCPQYPPEEIDYEVDKDGEYVLIAEEEIKSWQPRPAVIDRQMSEGEV